MVRAVAAARAVHVAALLPADCLAAGLLCLGRLLNGPTATGRTNASEHQAVDVIAGQVRRAAHNLNDRPAR